MTATAQITINKNLGNTRIAYKRKPTPTYTYILEARRNTGGN